MVNFHRCGLTNHEFGPYIRCRGGMQISLTKIHHLLRNPADNAYQEIGRKFPPNMRAGIRIEMATGTRSKGYRVWI